MSETHTPGPWRLMRDSDHIFAHCDDEMFGTAICSQPAEEYDHGHAAWAANAERIVLCCNAHDDLVAALMACLGRIESDIESYRPVQEAELARAALAKVKQ